MGNDEQTSKRPPPVTELKPREDCEFIFDIEPVVHAEIKRRMMPSEYQRFLRELARIRANQS